MVYDRKKLMAIAIFLGVSILIMLLLYGIYSSSLVQNEKVVEVKNIIDNNNSDIIHYNEYAYYKNEYYDSEDKFNSKISRTLINPSGDFKIKNLVNLKNYSISDEMKIYNDKLYYAYSNNTQQYDITTNESKFFCEGILQYIDEKKIVTLANGNLYSAEYYKDSYALTSYKQLTESNLNRLYEDANRIYYYGKGSNKNLLIVALNKENFSISILDNKEKETSTIKQMISTKNYIYYLIDNNSETYIVKLDNNTAQINRIIIDLIGYSNVDLFKNNNENNIYFFATTNSNDNKVYLVTESDNKIKEYNGDLSIEHIRRYSLENDDESISIFKDGNYYSKINNPLLEGTDFEIEYVYSIGDFIYLKINVNNTKNSNQPEYKYKAAIVIAKISKKDGSVQIINTNSK